MISINYKKHLGLGFLFFFEIILISSVFSQIPLEYDSYWWHTRRYWLLVYPVLLIATAIYIAFYRKCLSSTQSKVGCILYLLCLIGGAINNYTYNITGEHLKVLSSITYNCISEFGFFALGILLFTWGSRLWTPIKIAFTVSIALNIVCDIMFFVQYSIYENCNIFSKIDMPSTLDNVSRTSDFFVIVAFVLTIIWMCRKPKPDGLFESSDTYRPKLNEI